MSRLCSGGKEKVKKIVGYITTAIIAVILIAVFVTLITVFVSIGKGETPTVLGYRLYYVVTDSMTPNIVPGDVIISKKVTETSVRELQKGDIITYIAESGEMRGMAVTHRIYEGIHYDESVGEEVVTTRGDKAGAALDAPVKLTSIEAVMVRKSAAMTAIYKLLKSGAGFALILIIPLAIMLVSLIVRLVIALKSNEPEGAENGDEKAQAEADKEARIAEIKARAIAEYLSGDNGAEKPAADEPTLAEGAREAENNNPRIDEAEDRGNPDDSEA